VNRVPPSEWDRPRTAAGRVLLAISLATGLVTHAVNAFRYPLYLTDEGIYMQQAWSVLRAGRLSPYTYFYDHAPAGWLLISGWTGLLPGQFTTFGNAINTGRVLMVLVHLVSVFLLFEVTRRWSGSATGAFVAAFLFNVSPLAVYYQRQVLLDNLMVFWVLLALYLLTRRDDRVLTPVLAGLGLGIALVTKENTVFLLPGFAYLLHRSVVDHDHRRFSATFSWFAAFAPASLYLLGAQLKRELLPSGLSFDLNAPPTDHVSLLYTVWWQLNRSPEGGLGEAFAVLMRTTWLPKDRWLLLVGLPAAFLTAYIGARNRKQRPGFLVAGLLTIGYLFYLTRSVLLEFYVVPLVALIAVSCGLLVGLLMRGARPAVAAPLTITAIVAVLLMPGGYLLKHDLEGRIQFRDHYHLVLTDMQAAQVDFIRERVPPDANLITDDDIWLELRDRTPAYRNAHPHWKATSDPEVRDDVFHADWRNIDYVVMSNRMRPSMEQNNVDGQADWIFEAIDQHSREVWHLRRGDIELKIYEIQTTGE
jgi:4-amino-4-deoxy-L-arabinose transferase-like glycosyltransferase